ncbi:MAG: acyltransferase [Clostridia bacterium]|nr:acyltransferase [Clostridia bacterium]
MLKKDYALRSSGIELLKIIAIFLIMIHHVTQAWLDFAHLEFTAANMSGQMFVLLVFKHCGNVGNLIFFVSSAWFLADKTNSKKQKVIHMVMDIWLISVLFVLVPLLTKANFVSGKLVIKSLLPVTFENYWYMTCYLLFYLLFPGLNVIINKVGRSRHLRIAFVLSFLYIVVNNVIEDRYYYSYLILWIAVYFIVTYIKRYRESFAANQKKNAIIFIVSAVAFLLQLAVTWFVTLKTSLHDGWLLYWNVIKNPVIIVMAISLVFLASSFKFHNKIINSVSALSLLIYLIHGNYINRHYYLTYVWKFMYTNCKPRQVWAWILLYAAVLFIVSVIAAILYRLSLQKVTEKVSERVYRIGRKAYFKIEQKLFRR